MFHRDGAPVDKAFLEASAKTLSFRGPDHLGIWSGGRVGLGHALLRTTRESLQEHQPASLHEKFWITADARLDSHSDLIATLETAGCHPGSSASDAELILYSYSVWGENCIEHLRGDFAFALWDAQKEQLFCARDHFGIRPFYFALLNDLFLFSNTLNTIRFHPAVSDELNDQAVGDFLLFGLNFNEDSTIFRDIQRLPPAHVLIISSSSRGPQTKRYWSPPVEGRIRYRRAEEYVEHFNVLLQSAVSDRMRTDRVGILLSGGLDSGSVAAVAKERATKAGEQISLHSFTLVYESLSSDSEGSFAKETANFLKIPNSAVPLDHWQPFQQPEDPAFRFPQPIDNPLAASLFEEYRLVSEKCRVVFSGEGGDNLMHFQMWPHVHDMWRRKEVGRLFIELPWFFWIRPFPWRGIGSRLQKVFGKDPLVPPFPGWISKEFSRRLHLEERWKQCNELQTPALAHPIHPTAHASLFLPQWSHMFEGEDAGTTHHPVEVRYPFLDLRLVEYLLALPPFPWFLQKELLRKAMVGRLPEKVRTRRKTPVQGDPVYQRLVQDDYAWRNLLPPSEALNSYINSSFFGSPCAKLGLLQVSQDARPHCLNFWLQTNGRVQYK